jgi:hypothetical protein
MGPKLFTPIAKKKSSITQVKESTPLSPLHLAKHNKANQLK